MPIVITDADVRRHLSMRECIDAMRVCFGDLADGRAVSLPRLRYRVPSGVPDRSYFANVHVGAVPSYGVACVRAGSHLMVDSSLAQGRRSKRNAEPVNWTVIILYDISTAEPIAFLHESQLSGMRVAATTAVAMEEIARPEVSVMGLLGSGRQARSHLAAIATVRPIREVRVHSPNAEHLAAFVDEARVNHPGIDVRAVADARAAVEGADIVCSNTNSLNPVVHGAWLVPGQVVITIGNTDAAGRKTEVDDEVFRRADRVVVNHWASVEADRQVELLDAIRDGRVRREDVHELGDLVTGRARVRSTPDTIVYYKSNTGLAMQFAAAGAIVARNMAAAGGDTDKVIPRAWLGGDLYQIG